MRSDLWLLLSLHFALLVARTTTAQGQEPGSLTATRPNIVFVFSDDHAAHAISAYGSRLCKTPNIDRIANDGVRFANNFCGNALCGPSRATVLTGLHSHLNGFMRNGNTFDGLQPTMPKALQDVGYATAIFGKWHLESEPQGFDRWAVLPDQGHYYNPDFLTPQGRTRIEGHVTDLTTEMAIEWLERGRDAQKPFLLMCQHKAPHREWMPAPQDLGLYRDVELPVPDTLFDDYRTRIPEAAQTEMEIQKDLYLQYDLFVEPTDAERKAAKGPDAWWDGMMKRMTEGQRATFLAAYREENEAFRRNPPTGRALVQWKLQRYLKNYLRCIAGVDRSVGQLLDWLDAHPDIKKNTLVVYSSDQGFFLGEHGYYDKRWMYEECFRMPLMMQWPGRIEGGRTIQQLTQNIDFAPTFLELAGAQNAVQPHGKSLLPLLDGRGADGWRDAVYYHYYESQATHRVPAHFGVRTERHKLIRYYEPHVDAWELFDLQQDPNELRNLALDPASRDVRKQLEQRLVELRVEYGDTTGDLAAGAFPRTAGLARIQRAGDGYRVWANTQGGFAMRPCAKPDARTIATTMRPIPGLPQQNGFVVLGSNVLDGREGPSRIVVRDGARLFVGVAFARKRLLILAGDARTELASVPVEWSGDGAAEVVVTIDRQSSTVRANALGATATAQLPGTWREVAFVGYGASNAETEFSDLRIE